MGRSIFFFGDLDPKVTWVFAHVLREGDVALDVGANCGLLTIFAASLVGQSGEVHAFEPQPKLAAMIEQSALLNGFCQIHVHQVALSNENGTRDFFIPAGNCGAASLVGKPYDGTMTISVHVVSACEYLQSLQLKRVTLMKLDVEGHELAILDDAVPWLAKNRPMIILFEQHGGKRDCASNHRTVGQLLVELGYDVFLVPRAIVRVKLINLSSTSVLGLSGHDYVALDKYDTPRYIYRSLGLAR